MDVVTLITSLLSVVDNIMSTIPNYDQRKKEKYFKLKKAYIEEMNRENGDDNLTDNLRDELQLFIESFSEEISQKNLPPVFR